MALTTQEASLFGLDLSAVLEELRRPWRDLDRWPLMRWLTPELPVRVRHADGSIGVWRGDRLLRKAADIPAGAARYSAIELPDDLVLRRTLAMPMLPESEIAAAVGLEMHSVSPFPAEDMAWSYRSRKHTAQRLEVEAVLASRKQIQDHLATLAAETGQPAPEVWVLSATGLPILLTGFGEGRRAQAAAVWRGIGLALLLVAMALVAAIAVTPTAQLRLRALEGIESFNAVQERTVRLTKEREALVQATDRLKVLSALVDGQTLPMPVLDQLTRMLPDTTYLQTLKIEGRKITIGGQTVDAAALMQELGTQPGVHDVRAPAAAMRVQGASREIFQIEFTLDSERAAAAAAASAASSPASASASAPQTARRASATASATGAAASKPVP